MLFNILVLKEIRPLPQSSSKHRRFGTKLTRTNSVDSKTHYYSVLSETLRDSKVENVNTGNVKNS